MAMQSYGADDLLRVLVFSDPLSAEDYQTIRTYLTIALQLRYPRKRVDILLWCSSRSHSLAEKLGQIDQQSKFLAENNLPPCNWFLPLLFLPNEVPVTAEAYLSYPWSLCFQKIALAADAVASHTLLTTIAHSSSSSRAFSTGINSLIAKLATADERYLLDLNTTLSEAPTSTPTWSLICDDIASFISDQEYAWDNSEDDLLESLYDYLETHTIESEEGSFEVTYRKRVGQTRKYYRHGYTEAQLAYWRRELDKRCVLHIQNTPKAKRTQNSRMRISRPDRVTAESFLGSASSSPRKSKYRETARNTETPSNGNWNTPSTTSSIKDTSSTKVGFSGQGSANGVVVDALSELRSLNQLNLVNNSKRTHQEAFDDRGSFIGVGCISPDSESFAAMTGFPNPLSEAALTGKDSTPKPNISHPAFSRSYTTFKSPRERHKKGKVVVLKYTPKAEANPVAFANGGRQRVSSISADRNSMVAEERESSPNTPMEDGNVMDLDSPASPHPDRSPKGNSRASAPFARNINCTIHLPDYASDQRLVSDAALLARNPDPCGSNKLRNFSRIDAGDYANTLELATVDDIPDYVFNPHLRAVDVIRGFQGDLCRDAALGSMKPQLLAQMTGTIEPRVLGRMTSDEVVEAHLPVLEGYKAVYPGLFDEPPPPPANPPPPPPVLQVNGQIIRMRRDLIPNPLNLSASHPSRYQGTGVGFSAGQAQPQAPAFVPKFGLAAGAAFGVLVSQAQLPSPVSPNILAGMADDLGMARNTPEVGFNSAHVSRPLSSTPPRTPDLPHSSQVSRASQATQDSPHPRPHLQSVPDDVRQHWLGSISRNIRAGNCSFCGLAKEDPNCGHVIINRLELEEVEADKAVRHASLQAQAESAQVKYQETRVQEGQTQAQAQAQVQAGHQGQEEVIVAPPKRKRGRPPGSKNTAKTEKTAESAETAETTNSAETAKHAEISRHEKSPSWIREAKAEAEETARVEAAKEAKKRQKHGPDAIDVALKEASAAFGVPQSDSQDRPQGQTQTRTQTQVSIPNSTVKSFTMAND